MFDGEVLKRLAVEKAEWEAKELAEFLARQPEARAEYRTGSGLPVQRLYTPEDIADAPADNIGLPGRYPYTRGPYPTMYRGRNWTMRQIAGFGTGEDTNGRFRYLIAQGQTGLSVDFDMPTLMGYDSDDPRSLGEVGREGVAIDTLDDMEGSSALIGNRNVTRSKLVAPATASSRKYTGYAAAVHTTAMVTSDTQVIIGGAGSSHGRSTTTTSGSINSVAATSCPAAAVNAESPLNRRPYTPANAYVTEASRHAISPSRSIPSPPGSRSGQTSTTTPTNPSPTPSTFNGESFSSSVSTCATSTVNTGVVAFRIDATPLAIAVSP